MTTDELNRVRKKVIAQNFPSRGADLEGMLLDFSHALEQSPLLTQVRVKKTGEPDRMIAATGEPASPALAPSEMLAEVEHLWMEELRYAGFEAHAAVIGEEDVCLEFVTLLGPGGPYVTGSIVVDIRKLDLPLKPVSFWFRLLGAGPIQAGISDGVNEVALWTTYLSDGPGDLAAAVIALLQGAPQARCAWAEEPGEYRWVFERHGDELEIRILWFEETFSRQPDEQGELQFAARCRLRRFAAQVHLQLRQHLNDIGLEPYQQQWGRLFPLSAYEKLGELIDQA